MNRTLIAIAAAAATITAGITLGSTTADRALGAASDTHTLDSRVPCEARIDVIAGDASSTIMRAFNADLPIVLDELSDATGITFTDTAEDAITIEWSRDGRRDGTSTMAEHESPQYRLGLALLKQQRVLLNIDAMATPAGFDENGNVIYLPDLHKWTDETGAMHVTPANVQPGEANERMVGLRDLLRHELGHILGLPHVDDRGSVMSTPLVRYTGGPGLPDVDRAKLAGMYQHCLT